MFVGRGVPSLYTKSISSSTLHKKEKLSIKDFFSKSDQIRRKLWIWSHLLKKSLMKNYVFCAVQTHCHQLDEKFKQQYNRHWELVCLQQCCYLNRLMIS